MSVELLEPVSFLSALKPHRPLMGLDPGSRRIGIALSDLSRRVATPFSTLRRTRFRADSAHLTQLAQEHYVGGIIIGLPLNMDGSEGPRAQAARAFSAELARVLPLPLALWDERLSTQAARHPLKTANRNTRTRHIDRLAAAFILQGALDRLWHAAQFELATEDKKPY